MQGGYQLLDFGEFGFSSGQAQKIPFNIRDYVGKQVRVKGIYNKDVLYPAFDSNSIFTMNVISNNEGIVLTSAYLDIGGDANFLAITQSNSTPDFYAKFSIYTI